MFDLPIKSNKVKIKHFWTMIPACLESTGKNKNTFPVSDFDISWMNTRFPFS